MKKLLFSLIAAMVVSLAKAQVTPMVLGDKHAMLRTQTAKFVLLPVQETEEIASIAVLDGRNEMVQRLNVKLAVDRVDYYVPYELKGARLLDIEFHGDRRQKGAVGEFVCWKEMKFSDTFDTTNREHFRPLYHHTPLYGWMNDPNGMFYESSPAGNDGQAGAGDGVAPVLPVEPLRLTVGEHALGPLHVEGLGALGGPAHGLRTRLAGQHLQWLVRHQRF